MVAGISASRRPAARRDPRAGASRRPEAKSDTSRPTSRRRSSDPSEGDSANSMGSSNVVQDDRAPPGAPSWASAASVGRLASRPVAPQTSTRPCGASGQVVEGTPGMSSARAAARPGSRRTAAAEAPRACGRRECARDRRRGWLVEAHVDRGHARAIRAMRRERGAPSRSTRVDSQACAAGAVDAHLAASVRCRSLARRRTPLMSCARASLGASASAVT